MTDTSFTSPPAYTPEESERRIAERVAETKRRKAAEHAERQRKKTARDAGLVRRHATKLATDDRGQPRRNGIEPITPQPTRGDLMADVPPCCAEAGEICAQHQQAARVMRGTGPRNRNARSQRVIGESGRAKPVRESDS